MEGTPKPKRSESWSGKAARTLGLAAALHAESAVGGVWPETADAPQTGQHETAPTRLVIEDLLNVQSKYRTDLEEAFSRASTEQKAIIKKTLLSQDRHLNEYVHGEGSPDILRDQQMVRDVEKTGEMRPSPEGGVVLSFDDPQKYAAFEAAVDAASQQPLKPEEMQKITIEIATQAQIENWVRSIMVPARLLPK